MQRCIGGSCYNDGGQQGQTRVVAPEASSGWQWHTGAAVAPNRRVELVQQTGEAACGGPMQLTVQSQPGETDGHLVARVDWAQGGARFFAWFDVPPGQSVDLLGASMVVLSAGWVGEAPAAGAEVSASVMRTLRSTGGPRLSTPGLPIGASELYVPPFARAVLTAGTVEWRAGAVVLGETSPDSSGRALVPGGADRVLVTLDAAGVVVWELAL